MGNTLFNFKSEYSSRFVEEVERYLTESKRYSSLSAFAKEISKSAQYFSDLKAGKSDLTFSVLDDACSILPLNKEYILIGTKGISPEVSFSDAFELVLSQQRTIENLSKLAIVE